MIRTAAELILGTLLAVMTLRDVFDTVVVPGGSHSTLHIARRLNFFLLPVWKRIRGRGRGLSTMFAPFVLVASFAAWMLLLAVAFGLLAHAAGNSFRPRLGGFGDAIFAAGSALVTIGESNHEVTGVGRWVILAAGFCGLAVMTMAVTYLLEVQSSIARRDAGIFKLRTSAGDPPSAVALLEKYARIDAAEELTRVLRDGRDWCATVRQSHAAHPSLIYFRSTGTGSGWPAALGALLDLALIAEHLIDDDRLYGPAVLLREEGARMARELALVMNLEPKEGSANEPEIAQLAERLATSGYPIRANPDLRTIAAQRADAMRCVDALAEHLGRPTTMLVRQS